MSTRRLDEIGRLLIPVDERRVLGWSDRETLELRIDTSRGVMELFKPGTEHCAICGSVASLIPVGTKHLCPTCLDLAYKTYLKEDTK